MNDQPRAVRYIRTNIAPSHREADIARQLHVCENIANQHGLTVTETYEDIAATDKPALARLFAAAKADEIDIVICSSVDRISRDPIVFEQLLEHADVIALDVDTRQPSDLMAAKVFSLSAKLENDLEG